MKPNWTQLFMVPLKYTETTFKTILEREALKLMGHWAVFKIWQYHKMSHMSWGGGVKLIVGFE